MQTSTQFFTQLQADIVAASQKAFAEVAVELGGPDKVGGFCLATDDGAMTVVPVFAPREYLETYYEMPFEWQEWPIEYGADDEFNQICRKVAKAQEKAEDFEAFAAALTETMFAAAKQVRPLLPITEPFIFLLGVSDSEDSGGLVKMVNVLNSPEVSAKFADYRSSGEA